VKPTARAMWKASLELGALRVPIKLYAAAVDRSVHFRLVHAKDGVPVQRRLVHPRTGKPVAPEDARRGVEVESGVYVMLDERERARLEPEPSRAIRVSATVPLDALDERWYERPYYLGPDGEDERYAALAAALQEEQLQGIAAWNLRGHAYHGCLRAREGALVLVALRARDEVLERADLTAPKGAPLAQGELQLAARLLEAMSTPFEWGAWRDTHRTRVEKLVRDKRAGRKPRGRRFEPRLVRDDDLAVALKASLKRVS